MSRFTRLFESVENLYDSSHITVVTDLPAPSPSGFWHHKEIVSVSTILEMLLNELGYEIESIPRQTSSIKLVKKVDEEK